MSESEFAGLKEDIRLNGQREHATVWRGLLVDGRHRLRACEDHPDTRSVSDDETDQLQYALSQSSTALVNVTTRDGG